MLSDQQGRVRALYIGILLIGVLSESAAQGTANKRPRWEPRKRWPPDASCAGPKAKTRGHPGVRLQLIVTYLDDQRHLPIVKFKRAA